MNRIIAGFLLLIGTACSEPKDPLVGIWSVNNPYYTATYQITHQKDGFKAQIIYYDDGTSRYTSKDQLVRFEGLVKQDSIYVDGVSGASALTKKATTISIKIKNKDSLEATTYIMRKPLTEWWVKQK